MGSGSRGVLVVGATAGQEGPQGGEPGEQGGGEGGEERPRTGLGLVGAQLVGGQLGALGVTVGPVGLLADDAVDGEVVGVRGVGLSGLGQAGDGGQLLGGGTVRGLGSTAAGAAVLRAAAAAALLGAGDGLHRAGIGGGELVRALRG
ncbi:hypothetical protein B7486_76990, partial [cyanobacterium TDX16]